MRNLKVYNKNSYDFHNEVILKKKITSRDPEYKNRVLKLNEDIKKLLNNYDEKYLDNNLENLTGHSFSTEDKYYLLKLYSFKSQIFQRLLGELTTDEYNRRNNTCQYCSIGEVSSFDHYLPKEEFAEFISNPKNLVPCCPRCNSMKNSIWKDHDHRLFLNLYLDILPEIQYLFVNITYIENIFDINFYLDYQSGFDLNLFKLINSHYKRLNLLQRFKENSDRVVSELQNSIISFKNHCSLDTIRETIIESCELDKKIFGNNYWKIILKISLVENDDFMNICYY